MVRIHKEGYSFLFVLGLLLLGGNTILYLSIYSGAFLYLVSFFSLFVFVFFLQFFRHPFIAKNYNDNKIISPANGIVVFVGEVYEDEFFKEKTYLLSAYKQIQEIADTMEEELKVKFFDSTLVKRVLDEYAKLEG